MPLPFTALLAACLLLPFVRLPRGLATRGLSH